MTPYTLFGALFEIWERNPISSSHVSSLVCLFLWSSPIHTPIEYRCPLKWSERSTPTYLVYSICQISIVTCKFACPHILCFLGTVSLDIRLLTGLPNSWHHLCCRYGGVWISGRESFLYDHAVKQVLWSDLGKWKLSQKSLHQFTLAERNLVLLDGHPLPCSWRSWPWPGLEGHQESVHSKVRKLISAFDFQWSQKVHCGSQGAIRRSSEVINCFKNLWSINLSIAFFLLKIRFSPILECRSWNWCIRRFGLVQLNWILYIPKYIWPHIYTTTLYHFLFAVWVCWIHF